MDPTWGRRERRLIDERATERLGDVLRALREAAGLTQSALARKAGLNPSFVNRLESGQRGADRSVLDAITTALALNPTDADRLLVASLELGPEQTRRLLAGSQLASAIVRLGTDDPTLRRVAEVLAREDLAPEERDALRRAVELSLSDPTIRRVGQVLADPAASDLDRADFRQIVDTLARHWRSGGRG